MLKEQESIFTLKSNKIIYMQVIFIQECTVVKYGWDKTNDQLPG